MITWRLCYALAIIGSFIVLELAIAICTAQPVAATVPATTPTPTPQVRITRPTIPRPNTKGTAIPKLAPTGTATPGPTATPTPTPTASPTPESKALTGPWFAVATYYSWDFAGRPTALGEIYNPAAVSTACHESLLNEWLQVTNMDNGQSVVVRCNDTGPFYWNGEEWEPMPWWRVDLSEAAFAQIAPLDEGVILVEVVKVNGDQKETESGGQQEGTDAQP
ncbi:MAG: septal ring lytic transglycosylase RlpA family protein [Chloroflexi bacterium]|nr:septal ring lytic transglycosylase RlpA family protein [Chloroflexota bacterium]